MEPVASGLLAAEGYYQQARSRHSQQRSLTVSRVPWPAELDEEKKQQAQDLKHEPCEVEAKQMAAAQSSATSAESQSRQACSQTLLVNLAWPIRYACGSMTQAAGSQSQAEQMV